MTGPTPRSRPSRRPGARLTAGVAGLAGLGLVAGVGALAAVAPSTVSADGGPVRVSTTTPVPGPATTAAARVPTAGGPTGAAVAARPVGVPASTATAWDAPSASVTAPAESVVAKVAADQPVRIVTVRSVGGRPVISTRAVTGRAAAAAAVVDAQQDRSTVSVGVDEVLRIADDGTPVTTAGSPTVGSAAAGTTNDTLRANQWALTRLRADETWTRTTGSPVTVAVLDTGVQGGHPDLAGRVLPGVDLIRDVPTSTDGTNDTHGHGTHVAGIIAAVSNNNLGIAGLAPGTKILPVRVLGKDGSGPSSAIADGIVRATDLGAAILNLSLGSASRSTAISSAVQYALSKNVIVVAAAGNFRQSGNPVFWPASDTGVIGVAATDSTDKDAAFSNTGSYVDIAAPGVGIVSTHLGGTYAGMSGTSMAAPYVAATAALAKALSPGLTPATMTTLLQQTATDLGAAGRDDVTGYGLVDPYDVVCSLGSGCAATPAPTTSPTTKPTVTPTTKPTTTPTATPTTTPRPPAPVATAFTLTSGRGKTVSAGTSVTVTATLTSGSNRAPLRNAPIQLCVRTAPATAFTCQNTQTDLSGVAQYNASLSATTSVYFTFAGTSSTKASKTATAAHPVTAGVSLVNPSSGTLAVTVTPAASQLVTLDRWTGKTWSRVASTKVSTAGQASFTGLKAATYRVRVATSKITVGSTSAALPVR
ncbi:S8 family serine peptidase [Cryptosporangium minutisporangium]|uniref:Peptidase S8/S53 domain-containing protein n=1 Tax=Cryptosporangium minutisporangium TaxID=113569 RepID=A0ABP6T5G4_9ACTN